VRRLGVAKVPPAAQRRTKAGRVYGDDRLHARRIVVHEMKVLVASEVGVVEDTVVHGVTPWSIAGQ
jgi:hypothetical protein